MQNAKIKLIKINLYLLNLISDFHPDSHTKIQKKLKTHFLIFHLNINNFTAYLLFII